MASRGGSYQIFLEDLQPGGGLKPPVDPPMGRPCRSAHGSSPVDPPMDRTVYGMYVRLELVTLLITRVVNLGTTTKLC